MMTTGLLENWLDLAARGLAKESKAKVRREIQEHYEAAREAAMADGASASEAERIAVTALGDAKTANCQYRHVLLTSAEASMLQSGNREARAFCGSRSWLKWALQALPVAALLGAISLFVSGDDGSGALAQVLLVGAIGMGLLFAAPRLPVYTPMRSRIFRFVKWSLLAGVMMLASGPDMWKMSWLLASCLWPIVWIEATRMSIRRKMRVADWPKQLYL